MASLISGAAEALPPGVVNWIPLSVSRVWILYGTASISRSRKSRDVAVLEVSCSSRKGDLASAVDRHEHVELALLGVPGWHGGKHWFFRSGLADYPLSIANTPTSSR